MDITASFVKSVLPCRDPMGHKGTFGKVYGLCGAVGYTGAPYLAAEAAVRSGSGLVFLGVPESVWPVVAAKCDSAMPAPLPEKAGGVALAAEAAVREKLNGMDAFLLGCGLGRNGETEQLVRRLLDVNLPLVLDADGINALEGHIDVLACRRDLPTVLTPHAGEFARIGGNNRLPREEAAQKFAAEQGVVLVLKGHGTVVAAPRWARHGEHHGEQWPCQGRQRRYSLGDGAESPWTGDAAFRGSLCRRVHPRFGGGYGGEREGGTGHDT